MGAFEKSLWVFVGAGLGGVSRYWLGGWVASKVGPSFPWGTLVVNATGSLAIGILLGLLVQYGTAAHWRLVLGIGFLGGYTTFSTFAYETLALAQERSYGMALGNVVASLVSGLTFCWLGLSVARVLTRS